MWLAESVGPIVYFNDLGRWDNIAHDAINAVMTWIGDLLVVTGLFLLIDLADNHLNPAYLSSL